MEGLSLQQATIHKVKIPYIHYICTVYTMGYILYILTYACRDTAASADTLTLQQVRLCSIHHAH